jgi:long-chain fatty acid transport protein
MKLTWFLAAWIVLAVTGPCVASGTITNSLGARQAGRGGVNLAFTDNGLLLHDNPAGLLAAIGPCQDELLDLGTVTLLTDLQYADPQNGPTDADNDPMAMGHLSYARRVTEDLALGIGAFAPGGFASEYQLEGPTPLGGPQLYKSLGMFVRVLPGFSYRVNDRLSIGATLGAAISHLELEGPYFLNSGSLAGTPTLLDIQSTGAALSWSLGMQYKLTDRTTIAAHYQSQNRFQNNGNARVTIPGLGTSFYDMDMDIVWPRSLGVGLMQQLTRVHRLGLDVSWEQWSTAYDQIDLVFSQPNNPLFALIAGTEVRETMPLGWRDAVVVKAGIERDLGRGRTFRYGYRYQTNPVTDTFANTYLQTTLQHHFSIGYGTWFRGWQADIAYQFAFGPTLRPTDSGLNGDDFSNSTLRTSTHWIFLGLQRRF